MTNKISPLHPHLKINAYDNGTIELFTEILSPIQQEELRVFLNERASHSNQSGRDKVRFTEKELLHINTILTIHAIEHLPKECSCPECISIHKKIKELRQKDGEQG